jgi:hypothetical protein
LNFHEKSNYLFKKTIKNSNKTSNAQPEKTTTATAPKKEEVKVTLPAQNFEGWGAKLF